VETQDPCDVHVGVEQQHGGAQKTILSQVFFLKMFCEGLPSEVMERKDD
jgi:hypothetical protein